VSHQPSLSGKTWWDRDVRTLSRKTRGDNGLDTKRRIIYSKEATVIVDLAEDMYIKIARSFKCYQCEKQGHFARSWKCLECGKVLVRCECWMGEGENSSGQEIEMVVNVSGQKQKETDIDNALNKEMEDGGLGEENAEEEHQVDTGEKEKELNGEIPTSQGTVQKSLDMSEEQEEQKNNGEGYQEGRMERKEEEKCGGLGEDKGQEEYQAETGEKEKELDGEITTSQGTVQWTLDISEKQEEQKNNEESYQERRMERKGEEKCRKEREGIQRRRALKILQVWKKEEECGF
ncbi:hypothetical protein QTP70_001202, partial [Hemibagrus guttatus]